MNFDDLTLDDIDYFETAAGMSLAQFDPENGQAMGRPTIIMASILLFRRGDYPTRDDAQTAARAMTLTEAMALLSDETGE